MPSMPEQMPKRVSALIGKWLPALVFYIFLLLGQTLWHHKNLSKFLPINFLIISFNIKSCLSCQFSIYSWICVYFFTCFRRIGEFYPNIIFSKLVYSSFENELKGENSANTIQMPSVEGRGEQGDTKKPEKNYFDKWVLDADFSKVKINHSFLWRRSEFTSARTLQPSFSFFQELLAFKQLKLTLDTVLCLIPKHLQNCFGVCLFGEELQHSFNCLRQARLML